MKKTIFAGLTVLGSDESIQSDNGSFTGPDREEIDRALQIGVKLHRHTGEDGLTDPTLPASASIIGSGGTIPSGLSISVGYTLQDSQGGETLLAPVDTTTTASPLDVPLVAPVAVFDSASGTLLIDTYTYALTYLDGEGGETPIGPSKTVQRLPSFANGRILLSGLDAGLAEAGAEGWRLYRARGANEYVLLAEGELGDEEFEDDGSVSPNCDAHPPTDNVNTTNQINTLKVVIPVDSSIEDATFINLYASYTTDFGQGSFLAQYPAGSAGATVVFPTLEFGERQPPDVNRSYGGAGQIDPDTELLLFPWKKPVDDVGDLPAEADHGDVRIVLGEDRAYEFNASGDWQPLAGDESEGGGIGKVTIMGEAVSGGSELFDDFLTDSLGAGLWAGEPKDAVVEGGKLVLPTPFDPVRLRRTDANLDPLAVEQRFVVHVTVADALGNVEIMASYKDAENFLYCVFDPSNGLADTFSIMKRVGGEETSLKFGGGNVIPESGDAWFEVILKGEKVTQRAYTADPDVGAPAAVFTQTADMTADGDKALFFGIANEFGLGENANKAGDSILSFLAQGVESLSQTILPDIDTVEFRAGSGMVVTIEEDEEDLGHAIITYSSDGDDVVPSRVSGSASTASLGSGGGESLDFNLPGPAAHLIRLVTDRKARVRVYGDSAARAADISRAIGVDPEGDHGVQLDYVNDLEAGGGSRRLTPIVNAANLDVPPKSKLYLRVTNLEESSKVITVSFTLIQMEA